MEIIAALIIACSNLVQPGYTRMTDDDVIKLKKECIKRVSDCALKKVKSSVLECSKEVY